MPGSRKYVMDVTQESVVTRCGLDGCCWRSLTDTRVSAWRQFAAHIRHAHPGRYPRIAADADRAARRAS